MIRRIELVTNTKAPFWRMVDANGQTLSHSETYYDVASARRTAMSVADQIGVGLVEVDE